LDKKEHSVFNWFPTTGSRRLVPDDWFPTTLTVEKLRALPRRIESLSKLVGNEPAVPMF